jgi:polyisoprenoid-binding protein YceI
MIALLMLSLAPGGQAQQAGRMTEGGFGFRASVEGEPFEAHFGDFSVVPQLSPERQPTGFAVEVVMTAIDSGNADRDAEMRLTEWFDTAAHPVASFRTQEVRPAPQGGYVARGELRIKGIRRPIAVPFSWQSGPQGLRMTGEVTLDRRWFGVGPGDDISVAAEVVVFFDLAWGSDGH